MTNKNFKQKQWNHLLLFLLILQSLNPIIQIDSDKSIHPSIHFSPIPIIVSLYNSKLESRKEEECQKEEEDKSTRD
ncbi:MAG: hypothetical protein ACK5QS_17540 [Pseudanabaenaceae cyanobacterium]